MKRKFFAIVLVFMLVFTMLPAQSYASENIPTLFICRSEADFITDNKTLSIEKYNGTITLGATSQFGNKQIESVYLVTIQASAKLSIHTQSIWDDEAEEFKVDNQITSIFNTPLNNANSRNLPYDDDGGDYAEEPEEINAANFSNYITSVSELESAGINFASNPNLDTTSEYYFFAISDISCEDEEFSKAKLYGVLIQKKVSTEGVDKSALQEEIAKVTGENAANYKQSEDRYNGNDVSQVGFWNEMLSVLAEAQAVDQRQSATNSEVENARQALADAISKLIPASEANTTLLYEALQGIRNLPEENTDYTTASWDNYAAARDTAQTLFDGLFVEGEGGRHVANTENNTAAKQGEVEHAATVLEAAKADLLGSKGLEERLVLWNGAAQWLLEQDQQVRNGQYSNADAWNTAYADLEKAIAGGDGYQTQSKYDAYTSSIVALSAAYYNLRDSDQSDITVHVRVADNFGAMFPEYAIKDAKTATFDQDVTLGQGNKTISALLSAMGYDDTPITPTPSKGTQYGEGWKNPEVMVYINGTLAVNRQGQFPENWQGYIGKNVGGKLTTSPLNFDVQLHNGDEIVILRALGPGYNYYGDVAAGGAAYNFYYKSLALLEIQESAIEVEAGKPFSLTVTRTSAAAEETKTTRSIADVSLFVSEKQETEVAAQTAPALEAVGSKTDADGKATATLYKEGWYRLATVDVTPQTPTIGNNNGDESGGNFPNLAAGDYVLVHVTPSADTSAARASLQAELDQMYHAYAEAFYGADADAVRTLYQNTSHTIASSTLLGEAYDAQEAALTKLKQLQEEHGGRNDRVLEQLTWHLDHLPSAEEAAAGGFTQAYAQRFAILKKAYEAATDYQRSLLNGQQSAQYEALQKLYGTDGSALPAQKFATVKVTIEGDKGLQDKLIYSNLYWRYEGWEWFYAQAQEQWQKQWQGNETYGTFGKHLAGTFDSSDFKVLEGSDGYIFHIYAKDEAWKQAGKPVTDLGYEIYKIEVDGAEDVESHIARTVPTGSTSIYGSDGKSINDLYDLGYVTIDNTPANDITIKVYVRDSNAAKSLAEYQALAKEALDEAYQSYTKANYTTAGWAELTQAYQNGLAAIDQVTDETNAETLVENAKNAAIAAMHAVKTRAQEQTEQPSEQPTTGKYGSVRVTITNDTWSKSAMRGTFISETIPLNDGTTMMSAVLDALERNQYTWEGTGGTSATGKDITYIASIINPKNEYLGEFTGGPESGWMGTLNDWFTNKSFAEFGVSNGQLVDGDVIEVQYTCNLGKDIGSNWGDSDTSLAAMSVSGGKLTPAYTKSQKSYTLVKSGSSVNVSATAHNKNYQVRVYLNSKTASNYYRSGESIPVKAGDTIYVGVGGKGWPSMNGNAGYAISYEESWYEIKVVDSASSSEVVKLIDNIGKISYDNYRSKADAVKTARSAYDALTAEAKKKVKNYSALQEAEQSLTFYQQIDDAKAKLAALPKFTDPTKEQANAYRAQINAATAAYNKLSSEQKKYITKADVANYNALAKALGVETIAGSEEMPELPVKTTGKEGSATTTAPTDVKLSEKTNADGTKETVAEVKVNAEYHDEIIKQAEENKSAEIVLEVEKTDTKGADSVQLELDVKFVKNVADKTDADLTVNTENGKVTLDRETIKTVLREAKGSTITIEITKVAKPTEAQKKAAGENGYVIRLVVKSGDKVISDFNKGKAKVLVELPANLSDKKVAAIHIADDGKIEQLAGRVREISGKKYYEFTTSHFSTFALVDADELGLKVEEVQVDAKKLTAKLTPVARSAKTAKKNVKVTTNLDKQDKAIIKELKDAGYTVKYRFYRSTKKAAGYKSTVTKKTTVYTNTSGRKGTKYYYKVQVRIYDADGKLVAKTALKQCKYASRTWTKGK